MIRRVDLPVWIEDMIHARAVALNVSFDEALLASLCVSVTDPLAQTAGWAVERGERPAVVARRLHYSRRTVADATYRYRRLPNVGGSS